MEPVKYQSQQGGCLNSAAICSFYAGQSNVYEELKSQLGSLNVKTTLYTNYSMPCKLISDLDNKNVSKEDRVKLQNGQTPTVFSDDELTPFFENDLKVKKEGFLCKTCSEW